MAVALRLVLEQGSGVKRFILAGSDAIVGRAEQGDIVVPHETVSGRHGLFRATAAGYMYTDLGSRNGSAIQRAGSDRMVAIPPAEPTPLEPGDVLLLGSADDPARLRVELAQAPFEAGAAFDRTLVAKTPLADLLDEPPSAMVALAARAIVAETPESLARAAHEFLGSAFDVEGRAVQIVGGGFYAQYGDVVPPDLAERAKGLEAIARFEGGSDDVVTALAPLIARGAWHGFLAVWSSKSVGPTDSLSIAASLLALAASALATRTSHFAALSSIEHREPSGHRARLDDFGSREAPEAVSDLVGSSPRFLSAVDLAKRLAPSDVPLLLEGETGSGKEVFARLIHRSSARSKAPFVAINCGAIPPTLLEAELFGYVTGAFTGAGRDHPGVFEQAHGGTLFLDELGEMPLPMQAGILRALESGEVRRVGDTKTRHVDVRIVSATHKKLSDLVSLGAFRADLMYRLDAARILIPPLRERSDDILLIAHHLLGREAAKNRKAIPGFSPEALLCLTAYDFPGNVRELRNEIARAVALTPDNACVLPSAFSEKLSHLPAVVPETADRERTLKESVDLAERQAVQLALARHEGNITKAAKALGLSRPGLYKLLVRLGLRQGQGEDA